MLGQLVGAEPDDREHPEQPQSEPHGGGRLRAQRRRHGQHADVDAEVGHGQVAAVVAGEVDAKDQDGDGGQVGGDGDQRGHRDSSVGVGCALIQPSESVGFL